MEQMRAQAIHAGAEIVQDHIASVDFSGRPFLLRGESGAAYRAETVIIATGAQARWLGLPSEEKYRGYGVSACATCDGFFYRGKDVFVIGGGNTAVEEALFLTNFARSVTVVHRRDSFRAEKILQNRLFANPKIDVCWNSVVDEIVGEPGPPARVTGVRVRDVATGKQRVIPAAGFFVAIGHTPVTDLFKGQLSLDEGGYIVTQPDSTATEIPGVFAAGDVKDKIFRQAVTAAGMGCMAALEAVRFLAEKDHEAAHKPLSHHEAEKIGAW